MTKLPEKIGRYQILERVGKGGMGVLYRGVDPVLDREVAIKLMLADFSEDAEQMRPRFYREARAVAKLQHRNIVTIFEFAEEGNTPYIVMEFLRGTSLAARIETQPPLTLDDKLDIVTQLCAGLSYAHEQGVVHRDVKPANVFLLTDGTVKLLDFGIAKLTTSTLTRQGDVLGSASYMSPEQVMGSESVDARADIFSTGVVLYELLAGRRPFDAPATTAAVMKILKEDPPPLETVVPNLPPALAGIVKHALEKDPANRYRSAAELGRELQVVRRKLQAANAGGLGETQYASTQFLKNLHQQVDARSAAPRRPRWMLPAGIAAGVVVAAISAVVIFGKWSDRAADASASGAATTAASPAATSASPGPTVRSTPAPAPSEPKGPAVAPASSTTTTLQVSSDPPGAAIFLDNKDTRQITPASIVVKGPAPHQLRLTKSGFQRLDRRLTDADLHGGAVSLPLQQVEGAAVPATFTGAYSFELRDGSKIISPASATHQLNLPTGKKVRAVAADYFLDQIVAVEAGDDKQFAWQAPPLGKVSVRAGGELETCEVKIGDRNLGFPPLNDVTIAAGPHTFDLICQNGQRIQKQWNVTPGGRPVLVKFP